MTVIGIYPMPVITVIASNVSFHFNTDHVSSSFLPREEREGDGEIQGEGRIKKESEKREREAE